MNSAPVVCNLIVLRARDLARVETFYRALGLNFVKHAHGKGPVHLANETRGQIFEIYPLQGKVLPTNSTRIGFSVPSVDEAFQALLAVGGEPVLAPRDSEWGRRAIVADPEGHRVELTAPVA